ncbi:MAG: hypothetical protein SVG88_10995 [Halobacteriales archaeon]|nr:hypothetical protein [Halobacteriales archaeon]
MSLSPLVAISTVPVRFLAGVAGGVIATLAMDVVMARLPEGETPPRIAAGVLTESPPTEAPGRLATVVHYLAGGLTGPLCVWLVFASAALFGGPTLPAILAAVGVLYLLMVGFFVVVVLPRSAVTATRVGAIRRDWAVAAAAYLVVLTPIVIVTFRVT